jgi:alpha-ketoglutarate-dependent taurine dioxygenase
MKLANDLGIRTPLEPFGLAIEARRPGAPLGDLAAEPLRALVLEHRVVVLRGFAPPAAEALPRFGERLGRVLEWEFGAVNDLRPREDARNYIYTTREVPMHWDGAFLAAAPAYLVFHCVDAPAAASGGETLFADTVRLVAAAPAERRRLWERVRVTYATDKVVHYGGTFTSPLFAPHPRTGATTLRFAEPVVDVNPVRLEIEGIAAAEREALLSDLRARLYDPRWCAAHAWRAGDVVVADNHALLHGRRAFAAGAARHIRRVNVM